MLTRVLVTVQLLVVVQPTYSDTLGATQLPESDRDRLSYLLEGQEGTTTRTREGVARRIEGLSESLLGAGFAWNPIGEGEGHIDQDPLLSGYLFDCMSFVETVVVLARSETLDEAVDDAVSLRYENRRIAFETRRHFPLAQWVAAATSSGVLRNATGDIASPARSTFYRFRVQRAEWFRKLPSSPMYSELMARLDPGQMRRLREWGAALGSLSGEVEYLPTAQVLRLFSGLFRPDNHLASSLVAIVINPCSRYNRRIGDQDPASHLGILLRRDGKWVLRGTSIQKRAVVDRPLRAVLASHAKCAPLGLALFEVSPRLPPQR